MTSRASIPGNTQEHFISAMALLMPQLEFANEEEYARLPHVFKGLLASIIKAQEDLTAQDAFTLSLLT